MRNGSGHLGVLVAALSLFALVPAAPLSAQVNMTGEWALEVDIQGQIATPSMTLQQDGTSLTGHYSSQTLGEQDVTGTVEGDKVTVSFEADFGGQSAVVTYSGTVDAEGVWSGDFDLAGLAGGTFTGHKSSE